MRIRLTYNDEVSCPLDHLRALGKRESILNSPFILITFCGIYNIDVIPVYHKNILVDRRAQAENGKRRKLFNDNPIYKNRFSKEIKQRFISIY